MSEVADTPTAYEEAIVGGYICVLVQGLEQWRIINVSYLFSVVTEANETPDWTVLTSEDGDVAGLDGGGGLCGAWVLGNCSFLGCLFMS